jgi:hypothetical protein
MKERSCCSLDERQFYEVIEQDDGPADQGCQLY